MTLQFLILALHPADSLPHSDALGIPGWLQWLVGFAIAAAALWIVNDARAARRVPTKSIAVKEPDPQPAAEPRAEMPGERLVASDLLSAPRRTPRRDWLVLFRRGQALLRPLLFLAGCLLGWIAFDRAYAVSAFASFIGSDGTTLASRLAFAFGALLWVGAAVSLIAPRGGALAFAGAAAIGLFLTSAMYWEERLEWWGLAVSAQQWEDVHSWSGAAIGLALIALFAARNRSRDFMSDEVAASASGTHVVATVPCNRVESLGEHAWGQSAVSTQGGRHRHPPQYPDAETPGGDPPGVSSTLVI